MTDLAAFAGLMLGSMIDPLTWGGAALAVILSKSWPLLYRLALALGIGAGVHLALYALLSGSASHAPFIRPETIFWGSVSTVLWAGAFISIGRMRRGRSK